MESNLATKFEKMGARVYVTKQNLDVAPVRVDIRRDDLGEYFDVRHRSDVSVEVLDVRKSDRHLLLMAREPATPRRDELKSKFLCGHDERAWFVAAIPESARARDVQS